MAVFMENSREIRLTQDSDALARTPERRARTFVSHLAERTFSSAVGGALAMAIIGVAAPAVAQDGNPLDRIEEPTDAPDPVPVHQPAPMQPEAEPDHHHHHHPTAPPPRRSPTGPEVVGFDEKSEPRVGLIVGGSVLLAVAYLVPLSIVAAAEFPNETDWMAVPVAGPWMTIANMRYGSCSNRRFPDVECDDSGEKAGDVLGAVAAGFAGVMQVGGLAMLITGAAATKTKMVPIYATPLTLPGGGGVSISGAF